MEGLRQYAVSVIYGAVLCSVVLSVLPKGTGKALLKLLCGVFLTFLILEPITDISLRDLQANIPDLLEEAQSTAASGQMIAQEAALEIIKSETEAYILDKAAALHADIIVNIEMGSNGLPERAILVGPISPSIRAQLEIVLIQDLAIPKENQQWSG